MLKNWKMLVLWGALVWLIFFAVVSILMFTLANLFWLSALIEWAVSIAAGYLIVGKILKTYGGQWKEGLIYGVILMVVSSILDAGITVPTFQNGEFIKFYSNWVMWVGILLFLAAAAAAGYLNKGAIRPLQSNQTQTKPPMQPPAPLMQ